MEQKSDLNVKVNLSTKKGEETDVIAASLLDTVVDNLGESLPLSQNDSAKKLVHELPGQASKGRSDDKGGSDEHKKKNHQLIENKKKSLNKGETRKGKKENASGSQKHDQPKKEETSTLKEVSCNVVPKASGGKRATLALCIAIFGVAYQIGYPYIYGKPATLEVVRDEVNAFGQGVDEKLIYFGENLESQASSSVGRGEFDELVLSVGEKVDLSRLSEAYVSKELLKSYIEELHSQMESQRARVHNVEREMSERVELLDKEFSFAVNATGETFADIDRKINLMIEEQVKAGKSIQAVAMEVKALISTDVKSRLNAREELLRLNSNDLEQILKEIDSRIGE